MFKTAAVTENVANKSGLVNFTAVEKLYYVYYCYHCLKYEHFLYEVDLDNRTAVDLIFKILKLDCTRVKTMYWFVNITGTSVSVYICCLICNNINILIGNYKISHLCHTVYLCH